MENNPKDFNMNNSVSLYEIIHIQQCSTLAFPFKKWELKNNSFKTVSTPVHSGILLVKSSKREWLKENKIE